MTAWRVGFVLGALLFGATATEAQQITVKAGFNYAAPPWSWYDFNTGANNGAMIDLMTAVAKDAGFQVEFHGGANGDLVPMLGSKVVNVVISVWTPSPARQAVGDFTNPIVSFPEALVVSKFSTSVFKTLDDLHGKSIAAGPGTAYEQALKEIDGVTVKSAATNADGWAAISSGQAVAYLDSQPEAVYRQRHDQLPEGITVAQGYRPQIPQQAIFAVEKGSGDLLGKINASLAKFAADGTMRTIFAKYGVQWTAQKN